MVIKAMGKKHQFTANGRETKIFSNIYSIIRIMFLDFIAIPYKICYSQPNYYAKVQIRF